MTKRAVIYGRVSGDDRDNEGRNLAGQIDMGRDYAKQKTYSVLAELAEDDRGASGAEINLPMLNKIRSMARAGEVDVVVVREVDRFSRNLAKQLIVEQELKNHGVSVEYVIGQYPDTPEGNFMKHVRASVAEFEREKIIERTVRGRELKLKAGSVLLAGNAPYGYRVVQLANGNYTLEVNEDEAKIVKLIFQWYLGGRGIEPMSIQGIAVKLSRMRVPSPGDLKGHTPSPKQKGFGFWGRSAIGKIISNESYIGVWHYGKQRQNPIAVSVPTIIARETFQQAVDRRRMNKHSREPLHEYLLARVLKCSCGYALGSSANTNHSGKLYTYYVCAGINRNSARSCTNRFNAGVIDEKVWEWLLGLLSEPEKLEKALAEAKAKATLANIPLLEELETTDKLIAEQQARKKRIQEGFEGGLYDLADSVEKSHRIDEALRSLTIQRAETEERIQKDAIADADIAWLLDLANDQADKVRLATRSFEVRRTMVLKSRLKGVLTKLSDGSVKIDVSCILGSTDLWLVPTSNMSCVIMKPNPAGKRIGTQPGASLTLQSDETKP